MTDRDLVHLLTDAEAGNDAALRNWLALAPEAVVNERLSVIASRADHAGGCLILGVFFLAVLMSLRWLSTHFGASGSVGVLLFGGFLIAALIIVNGLYNLPVRKGRCAIFYLAERNYTWAIFLLASDARHAGNLRAEETLLRLLEHEIQQPGSSGVVGGADLRILVEAIALPSPLFARRQLSADLSASRACLAVAALRYLGIDWTTRKLFERIAARSVLDPISFPNRALIRDAALFYLSAPASPKATVGDLEATEDTPTIVVSDTSSTHLIQTTHHS